MRRYRRRLATPAYTYQDLLQLAGAKVARLYGLEDPIDEEDVRPIVRNVCNRLREGHLVEVFCSSPPDVQGDILKTWPNVNGSLADLMRAALQEILTLDVLSRFMED